MYEEIILSGFGGQGLMLLGKVIAQSALIENKHVSWLPSYGAEVRSGTAHCMVVISDKEIGSCFVDSPTIAILLNEPSLRKFKHRIEKGGLMILNSSLVNTIPKRKDIKIVKLPLTEIAINLGNVKTANMIALGVMLAKTKLVKLDSISKTFKDIFAKKLCDINKKAFQKGYALGKE